MDSEITDTILFLFLLSAFIIQIPLTAYLIEIKCAKLSLDINFKNLVKPSFFGVLLGAVFDVIIEFSSIYDFLEDDGIFVYALIICQFIISIILIFLGFNWYIIKYSTDLINLTNKEFRKVLIYSIIKAHLIALFSAGMLYFIIRLSHLMFR